MFDFPEPFNPVMALKDGSHPVQVSRELLIDHSPAQQKEFTCDCGSHRVRLETYRKSTIIRSPNTLERHGIGHTLENQFFDPHPEFRFDV
jgi:hypothetical protein